MTDIQLTDEYWKEHTNQTPLKYACIYCCLYTVHYMNILYFIQPGHCICIVHARQLCFPIKLWFQTMTMILITYLQFIHYDL